MRFSPISHVLCMAFSTISPTTSKFAYNVATLVFEGPDAELNKGMKLTLKRKQEIEAQVLKDIRAYLEFPSDFRWGKFPMLYK